MDRTIKEYFGDDRYNRYVNDAKGGTLYGMPLADFDKEDLYAVIGFLSAHYVLKYDIR